MSVNKAAYAELVRAAFPTQNPPRSVAIEVGDTEGIDASDIRRDFPIGTPWDQIPASSIEYNCHSLPFFSDEGYRYYLPAFLMESGNSGDVYQFLLYSLSNSETELDPSFEKRCSPFNQSQSQCILMLLEDAGATEGRYHISPVIMEFWRAKAK